MSSLTGTTNVLDRGMLRELLSTGTTVTPDATFAGKILVLNLPPKRFDKAGTYTQTIFKYCWQRAVERRAITRESRPVFIWADEAQLFVNEHDTTFQTTARSARACTVFLTQNLPNYHYYLGGDERARSLTKSLLGNLTTKIFHNNGCVETNKYAAELFGRNWRKDSSSTLSENDGKFSSSSSTSDKMDYVVQPREFSDLATGGPQNHYQVEAIIHQGGRIFSATGKNALLTAFQQSK